MREHEVNENEKSREGRTCNAKREQDWTGIQEQTDDILQAISSTFYTIREAP